MAQSKTTSSDQKVTTASTVKQSASLSQQKQNQLSELPGYPAYVNTGNKEVDDANYIKAQNEWTDNNKELYLNYIQNNNSATNSSTKKETTTTTTEEPKTK